MRARTHTHNLLTAAEWNSKQDVRIKKCAKGYIYIKWERECFNLGHNKRNDFVLLLASAMPQQCCTASATATTSSWRRHRWWKCWLTPATGMTTASLRKLRLLSALQRSWEPLVSAFGLFFPHHCFVTVFVVSWHCLSSDSPWNVSWVLSFFLFIVSWHYSWYPDTVCAVAVLGTSRECFGLSSSMYHVSIHCVMTLQRDHTMSVSVFPLHCIVTVLIL